MVILWCELYKLNGQRCLIRSRILTICRLSSVVEHAHGKGGVMSSNLIVGSTRVNNSLIALGITNLVLSRSFLFLEAVN